MYRQQKRQINELVRDLLCAKVSMRRCARILKVVPRTIDARLEAYARQARLYYRKLQIRDVRHVQFDELQSSIHSKCKPVAIPTAVCADTRRILAIAVVSMPAQHPLVEVAARKYGPRADDRASGIERVLKRIRPMLARSSVITTDMAYRYPASIARILPQAMHVAHFSRRARYGGQGELKRIGLDPLFALNHTAGMIRDGVGRMVRKTWGNSKRLDKLERHLLVYAHYHNEVLLKPAGTRRG